MYNMHKNIRKHDAPAAWPSACLLKSPWTCLWRGSEGRLVGFFQAMNLFDRIGALPLRVLCSVLVGTVVVVFSSAFANTLDLKAFQGLSERVSAIAAATVGMRWPGSGPFTACPCPIAASLSACDTDVAYLYCYRLQMLTGSLDWLARPPTTGNFTPGEIAVVPRPLPAWHPIPAMLYRFVFGMVGRVLEPATPLLIGVSLSLHLASTFGIFALLLKLLQDSRAAFIAAMIFVLHPLHTDAVRVVLLIPSCFPLR